MMLADRYRLDALLGRGGMGEVWRAWDFRLSRPVAVKVLDGSGSAQDAAARLRHEARTAARLHDPHAVDVYDVGIAAGCCFLVMELVPGRSLSQELREEGPLDLARVAEVAAQAAAGLAAAHLRGVVHRDIKPSNLLTGEDGSVKIADFGIARAGAGDTTQPGVVFGTSLYLSPEAAAGGHAGCPADVYSLGCSLYELLTGQPPFPGEYAVPVLRCHVEDEPVPPQFLRPEIPQELNDYLLRMLAKQPERRPTAEDAAVWFAEAGRREERPGTVQRLAAAGPAVAEPAVAGHGADTPPPPSAAPRRPDRRQAQGSGRRRGHRGSRDGRRHVSLRLAPRRRPRT